MNTFLWALVVYFVLEVMTSFIISTDKTRLPTVQRVATVLLVVQAVMLTFAIGYLIEGTP